jgi:hypothetical protein
MPSRGEADTRSVTRLFAASAVVSFYSALLVWLLGVS